jgi:hypothetical protein
VPSELIFVLPYAAALVAGLVLSYKFPQHKTKHALSLGILISVSLGAINLVAERRCHFRWSYM